MSDDVTITVRVNNQTAAGFRDINGQLRTLDGRFAASAQRAGLLSRAFVDVRSSLLSLAPAAVPVAASLAPIATHAAGAGVAVAAFGAAVVPQISNLADAAKAQDKYSQAVQQYGQYSKQAITAQQQAAQTLSGMPKATQQAAAAYSVLRGQFKGFSDSTAKFTMAPVEHSFAVLGTIIPKLKPMVEGTSTQLDRLVKVAGGAVNTSGFDTLSDKASAFANRSLKDATDGAIHFIRVMSEGDAHGPIAEFMDYAREQGPVVKDLLSNLMQALGNIAEGAAEAGPGLLTVVNAFAKLVAAAPPELVGTLMQIYAAFKLIKLAGAGIAGAAGGFTTLAGKVAALQAASAAAGGGLAGLKAAFLSLGTTAKASVVVAGIAALALILTKLASIGKTAPPDVDRMTTAITNLGRTGKVSGEALRAYGKDLGGLADSLRTLARPSNAEKTQQFLTSLIGMDSTPVKKAKEDLDGVDKALANMVRGGKADLAKAAFNDIAKAMEKQGLTGKELKGKLDDYKSALADQALEQKLAAQSMGLFGQAAQDTKAKLDAQKASADGLRQSIQALNDANRQGLGGMIGFEAAIDAASAGTKKYHDVLSMNNGQLSLNSGKQREAAQLLSDLASKTDEAAASARESGSSWEAVNGIYSRGRSQLIKSAQAMGLTKTQARQLADQILKIPDKTAKFKMNTEDARHDLNSFNAAVKRSPGSKSVTLKTLSKGAEAILKAFGFKVKHLPNGKVKVTAAAGGALSAIGNVSGALSNLDGKTANTYVVTHYKRADGASFLGASGRYASGGKVRGYASGGNIQAYPDGGYIQGPGSGTSDSILTLLGSGNVVRSSNTEFIVNSKATAKHRRLLELINSDRLPRFAKGGVTKAEAQARREAMSDLTISHFGHAAGYQRSEFGSALAKPDSISSLVNSLNEWRRTIMKATHGSTENKLLRQLDSTGKKLLSYEKQLSSVTKSLEKAKDKLDSLKDAAAQLADSVKSNIVSGANITRAASGEDSRVTINTLLSQARGDTANAQEFASDLDKLKKAGLSGNLLEQIASAGVEGGGLETAQALLGANSGQIKELNDLNHNLRLAASGAGKTASDAMYSGAIKFQQIQVNKLTHSQEKLARSMDKLAKSMEKSIEKAFGKAAGGIVGAAAAGGLRSNLTWVGEHGPELLDLPAGSRVWSNPDSRRMAQAPWASMLNTPRTRSVGRATAGTAGGGSERPIVIHLSMSDRDFGEVWVDTGRKMVKTRGGLTATLGS